MSKQIRSWLLAATALAVLGPGGAATLAQDDLDADYGDEYASGDYGRVRHAEYGLSILRAQWDQEQDVSDEGFVNSPLFPGDEITTGSEQRVEVEVLQLAGGRVRMSTSLRDGDELRVDTPAASVYPVGDADLRLEVTSDGTTRVASRRGVVEVVGSGGSVILRGGTRTEVQPGSLPYDPEPFNTFTADSFDRYVEEREEVYSYREGYAGGPEVYRELPSEIRPYYRELSAHGDWIYTDEYGYLWQPAGMADDWRPYHNGTWSYGPHGYFWVSHEPWGWAPHHYGRWSWLAGRGWCWFPGRAFAGAWVSWSWGSAYVGWGPLDYWDYPAYRSAWHYGYYDPFCWTFISYHHFHHHHYGHYSVSWNHVSHDVHRNAVVTRPPRIPPRRIAGSAAARARAYRDARDDTRRRVPPRDRSGATRDRSFRAGDTRRALDRSDARSGRSLVPSPEGRTRRTPTSVRTRDARAPGERRRERMPVVSQPRDRRGPTRDGRGSSADRDRRTTPSPRARPTPGGSNSESAGARQGTADRLRDLYRRMARPRQTRETPSATPPAERPGNSRARPSQPSRGSSTSRAKPSRPSSRSGSSRATPSKPSRPRPKSSGGSRTPSARPRPKPKSSGSKKPKRSASYETSRSARTDAPRQRTTEVRSRSVPRPGRTSATRSNPQARRSAPAASRAPSRSPSPRRNPSSVSRTSPTRSKSSARSSRSTPSRTRSSARPSRSRPSKSSSRGGSKSSSRRGRKR